MNSEMGSKINTDAILIDNPKKFLSPMKRSNLAIQWREMVKYKFY